MKRNCIDQPQKGGTKRKKIYTAVKILLDQSCGSALLRDKLRDFEKGEIENIALRIFEPALAACRNLEYFLRTDDQTMDITSGMYLWECFMVARDEFRHANLTTLGFDYVRFRCERNRSDTFMRILSDFSNTKEESLRSCLEQLLEYKEALAHTPISLRSERGIIMTAVSKNGTSLKYAPDEFKDDEEIVLKAVTNDRRALEFASDRLKNNAKIVAQASNWDVRAIQYASDDTNSDM